MSTELDISWQDLSRLARQWGGQTAQLSQVKHLWGGCISSTVLLELTDARKAVCKISAHRVDRSYVNEAHQLKMISELGIPVPRVYATNVGSLDDPFSYILLEFVEGVNLREAKKLCSAQQYERLEQHLAELMLLLHEHKASAYGRAEVAPAPPNFNAWPEFFRHVFDPICRDVLKDQAIPVMCRKRIGKIHERLDVLLRHDDGPRLVHWDAWASNILARPDAAGDWKVVALLDPNCKFAHAEAELAYMTQFHTAGPAFMKSYQRSRKLGDDYHRIRKPIYQFYFLISHVHLFGAEYIKPLAAAAEQLENVA